MQIGKIFSKALEEKIEIIDNIFSLSEYIVTEEIKEANSNNISLLSYNFTKLTSNRTPDPFNPSDTYKKLLSKQKDFLLQITDTELAIKLAFTIYNLGKIYSHHEEGLLNLLRFTVEKCHDLPSDPDSKALGYAASQMLLSHLVKNEANIYQEKMFVTAEYQAGLFAEKLEDELLAKHHFENAFLLANNNVITEEDDLCLKNACTKKLFNQQFIPDYFAKKLVLSESYPTFSYIKVKQALQIDILQPLREELNNFIITHQDLPATNKIAQKDLVNFIKHLSKYTNDVQVKNSLELNKSNKLSQIIKDHVQEAGLNTICLSLKEKANQTYRETFLDSLTDNSLLKELCLETYIRRPHIYVTADILEDIHEIIGINAKHKVKILTADLFHSFVIFYSESDTESDISLAGLSENE